MSNGRPSTFGSLTANCHIFKSPLPNRNVSFLLGRKMVFDSSNWVEIKPTRPLICLSLIPLRCVFVLGRGLEMFILSVYSLLYQTITAMSQDCIKSINSTNFQVKATGIRLNHPLLLVQPSECYSWGSGERQELLPITSSAQRYRHVQLGLDLLLLTAWWGSIHSFTVQNVWLILYTLCITLSAGSSCSLFCLSLLCCLFCISGAPLRTMFWFFFFFPPGLQQHSIWRLHKPWWLKPPNQLVRSVSPPCYRREADRHRQQVSNPKSCGFLPFVRWW